MQQCHREEFRTRHTNGHAVAARLVAHRTLGEEDLAIYIRLGHPVAAAIRLGHEPLDLGRAPFVRVHLFKVGVRDVK